MSTVKLLGLNTSTDLRWNCHVAEISKKVASRLYFLKQLKRANIPAKDLLIFYLTFIRPVTEYACPVFHNVLPAYLSAELEQLQKRTMRIIFFPFVPYSDALHQATLETLSRRRQSITTKLFDSTITCNSDHNLHELLPPRKNCESNLRRILMSLWLRRRDLRTHLYIATVIKLLATHVYIFHIFFLIFLLDFIIVTINLIQLLAAILIRINYLSIYPGHETNYSKIKLNHPRPNFDF